MIPVYQHLTPTILAHNYYTDTMIVTLDGYRLDLKLTAADLLFLLLFDYFDN